MVGTVLLGAGIGGLSFAHYYLKRFPKETLTVFEASHRIGGWIKSINKDGVIIEQGPRSIRPKGLSGANTLQLVEELNLANDIVAISSNHPAALNRMIYVNGELHSLPFDFMGLFKKQTPFSQPLYKYILKFLWSKGKPIPTNDESLYNFVKRKFGKDIADYAISPLVCGICAGDAKEISVRFLMDSIFEKDQKYKNMLTAFLLGFLENSAKNQIPQSHLYKKAKEEKWSIYSFKNGVESLARALENSVTEQSCQIQLNKQCDQLIVNKSDVTLLFSDQTKVEADYVVSAIPAYKLGELVREQYPTLGYLLNSIHSVTVAVINLEYDKELPIKPGFGFLVPPKENLPILGVIFDSCCFEHTPYEYDDKTVLTVMLGGRWYETYFGEDYEKHEMINITLKHLKNILNIEEEPYFCNVSILRNCIPQYTVGHKSRVKEIYDFIKKHELPLSLCGNSYDGVGINDVILSSKKAVSNIST